MPKKDRRYSYWLVRLSKIGDKELRHRLEWAWRHKAPKRLVDAFDGKAPAKTTAQRQPRR